MEDSSSREAEVSSREEACSLAPSARLWLDWLTWLEAEEIWSLPADRASMTRVRALEMERLRKTPMAAAKAAATTRPVNRPRLEAATASLMSFPAFSQLS